MLIKSCCSLEELELEAAESCFVGDTFVRNRGLLAGERVLFSCRPRIDSLLPSDNRQCGKERGGEAGRGCLLRAELRALQSCRFLDLEAF